MIVPPCLPLAALLLGGGSNAVPVGLCGYAVTSVAAQSNGRAHPRSPSALTGLHLVTPLSVVVLLASCSDAPSIRKLLDRPQDFDGRTVTVAGTAQDAFAIVGIGGYHLADEGRAILVLVDGGVPPPGQRIVVSGMFVQALAVGAFEASVIIVANTPAVRAVLEFKRGKDQ